MTSCSVCDHPEHDAITRALETGASLRQLEAQFPGISRSALSRHTSHRSGTPPTEKPPVPSLCPIQSPDEHTTQRARLVDAQTAAHQQLATITDAIDVHAVDLAKMLALEAVRVFQPLRSDDDLRHLVEYQQWMERPKQVRSIMEELLTSWRQALHGLKKARWNLAAHDQTVAMYARQREVLDTPRGEELQLQFEQIHAAMNEAKRVGNARLIAVYEGEIADLRQAFALAVSQAANRRAA